MLISKNNDLILKNITNLASIANTIHPPSIQVVKISMFVYMQSVFPFISQ